MRQKGGRTACVDQPPAGVKVGVKTQADVKAELWLSWTHIFWDRAEVSGLRKCFSLKCLCVFTGTVNNVAHGKFSMIFLL